MRLIIKLVPSLSTIAISIWLMALPTTATGQPFAAEGMAEFGYGNIHQTRFTDTNYGQSVKHEIIQLEVQHARRLAREKRAREIARKQAAIAAAKAAAAAAQQKQQPQPQPIQSTPGMASAAPGSFQQCVISRESGGNPQAVNPSSGAGGLYQFLPSTWAALGFPGLPEDASVATQNDAFAKAYAMWGTSPWAPYDGC